MKRVALIGHPLRRPHSAIMHNAAFDHFAIDARYSLMDIEPEELDACFAAARGEEWLGLQVTAPYKQEAARRCDEVEDQALQIGAVNSIVRRSNGALLGFNTDSPGFLRAIRADLGFEPRGAVAAVAGAGGAARAVVHALLEGGAAELMVGSRGSDTARALADQVDDERLTPASLGEEFDRRLASVDLAVNATTVGMTSPGASFDVARLPTRAAVFDLVYVPPVTELVAAARERGLPAAGGLEMLVAQAEIAFERWTGIEEAGTVMRRALDDYFNGSTEAR